MRSKGDGVQLAKNLVEPCGRRRALRRDGARAAFSAAAASSYKSCHQCRRRQSRLPASPTPPLAFPRKPAAELPKPAAEAAKPAARPAERNEFQEFIEASTGQRLPIFGHKLFEGAPSTFAPVENIPVPADYIIGPGDELLMRAWGQIDVDYRAVVDRNGTINIPRVGSIPVAGIKYEDLTNYVRTAVAATSATSTCWSRWGSCARCRSSSSATRAAPATTP